MIKFKIADIVETISGEIGLFPQGAWCTIVRFMGCNLRCPYCDTKSTWADGSSVEMTVDEIMQKIHTRNVLITGGEPLVQSKALDLLLTRLMEGPFDVQVETNGSIPLTPKMTELASNPHLLFVVDYKGPSSKQNINFQDFIDMYSVLCENEGAVVKMVISSYNDLQAITQFRELFDIAPHAVLAFSPVDGRGYWAKYILEACQEQFAFELANGQIVLSVQIHKNVMMP